MFTKTRKPRAARSVVHSDAKLRKASDYLEFDIHSLAAAIEIFNAHRGTEIGNAALDSFLARARVLIDFLMKRDGAKDDVLAIDYFHDFTPKPYRPTMPQAVRRERQKINKRLMHLTTRPMPRLRSNQRYALARIARPIARAFRAWLALVPNSRLQKPAKKTRADYERHLSRIDRLVP
jgi:hypothetical protein